MMTELPRLLRWFLPGGLPPIVVNPITVHTDQAVLDGSIQSLLTRLSIGHRTDRWMIQSNRYLHNAPSGAVTSAEPKHNRDVYLGVNPVAITVVACGGWAKPNTHRAFADRAQTSHAPSSNNSPKHFSSSQQQMHTSRTNVRYEGTRRGELQRERTMRNDDGNETRPEANDRRRPPPKHATDCTHLLDAQHIVNIATITSIIATNRPASSKRAGLSTCEWHPF